MTLASIHIQLLGPWHPGTGRGEGPGADAVVNTDAAGLPFLPGRTLKGLLREGARIAAAAGALNPDLLARVFGHDGAGDDATRYRTVAGALHLSSATVGEDPADAQAWQEWARENAAARAHLFRTVASTRLDDNGVAADGTLRTVQVAVPVPLVATAALGDAVSVTKAEALTALRTAAPLVYALGAHRTRGLGRCIITVREA